MQTGDGAADTAFDELKCERPDSQGYSYPGLTETEQLAMVLWRPLFEGLAIGLRSNAKTSATGFGCLVQRGSILALRSILLRHGHIFSSPQLYAILSETVLPAIQAAIESDVSAVTTITSENPSMTTIDFLVDPLPLPPDAEDAALLSFLDNHGSTMRQVGPAELMLEASLTDVSVGALDFLLAESFACFPHSCVMVVMEI